MAMTTDDVRARERRDIEALLPWHAAGALSARDAERVEAALAGDGELARRYELVREELGETIRLNETLGAPSLRAMERLMAAIEADAAAARQRRRWFRIGPWIAGRLSELSPRALTWSATAAALAIVLQAGLIAGLFVGEHSGKGFETVLLEDDGQPAPGAHVLLGFTPDATMAEITRFLQSHNATVIEGPKQNALFRVRVADHRLAKDDLARIVRQMQEDGRIVRFAAATE
jgi:hypothetical protein